MIESTGKPKAKSRPTGGSKPTKSGPKARREAEESTPRLEPQVNATVDWREQTLARMRALILEAEPRMLVEQKWKKPSNGMVGVPVWSHNGIVCTGEVYRQVVKLTFAKGASVPDPSHLFNSSLEGNTRRAIDIREGETVDAAAFKALVQAAVAQNNPPVKTVKPVKFLSGGNPQIAKADGDAPVQAYIAALPGWKRDLGQRLDALIVRTVPGVSKAVKWNSPFYGSDGKGWFLSLHAFTKYVKVAFFRGTSLCPVPPGESKSKDTRYLDIYEGDELDEAQMTAWVKQADALPGWAP